MTSAADYPFPIVTSAMGEEHCIGERGANEQLCDLPYYVVREWLRGGRRLRDHSAKTRLHAAIVTVVTMVITQL